SAGRPASGERPAADATAHRPPCSPADAACSAARFPAWRPFLSGMMSGVRGVRRSHRLVAAGPTPKDLERALRHLQGRVVLADAAGAAAAQLLGPGAVGS